MYSAISRNFSGAGASQQGRERREKRNVFSLDLNCNTPIRLRCLAKAPVWIAALLLRPDRGGEVLW